MTTPPEIPDSEAFSVTPDDLTAIKGIGPARQRWLRDEFQVDSLHDLAQVSPDELEQRLKAEGKPIARSTIESWITQAQELIAGGSTALGYSHPPTLATEKGWKPFASFVVEFQMRETESGQVEQQTVIHHMEADRNQAWVGVVPAELQPWIGAALGLQSEPVTLPEPAVPPQEPAPAAWSMDRESVFSEELQRILSQAERLMPRAPAEASAPGVPSQVVRDAAPEAPAFAPAAAPAALDTTQVVAQVEPLRAASSDAPETAGVNAAVRAGQPFSLWTRFTLSGLEAAALERPTSYRADFYASNLATGSTSYLGQSEPHSLVDPQTAHELLLSEAVLLPGVYRLQIVLKLEGVPVLGYLEMPLLQVV